MTIEEINKKIKEFKISQVQICKDFGLKKSYVSSILSGRINLSKPMKAAFKYYFLYLDFK